MQEIAENILTEALSEALETIAFMMVMPPEDELPAPSQGVQVTINFTGPISGTIDLLASDEFTLTMAANVLGIDCDQEAQAKGTDAFKDLLNITCGVLLPMLASSETDVFNLTVPEARDFQEDEWEKFVNQPGVNLLDVDGELMATRLTITK